MREWGVVTDDSTGPVCTVPHLCRPHLQPPSDCSPVEGGYTLVDSGGSKPQKGTGANWSAQEVWMWGMVGGVVEETS